MVSPVSHRRIRECYFIVDRKCATTYGFDDDLLYDELVKPLSQRKMLIEQQKNPYSEVINLFENWKIKDRLFVNGIALWEKLKVEFIGIFP